MPQHSSLSPERWAQFNLDQQILMIGNEMNRGKWSIEQGTGRAFPSPTSGSCVSWT